MNKMNNCSGQNSQGQNMGSCRGNMNRQDQNTGNCRGNMNSQDQNMGNCRGNMNRQGYRGHSRYGVMGDTDSSCMPRSCQNDPSADGADDPLYGMPLGMGYVPWQQWGKIYNPQEGLANATIFPELNLPFYGCIPQGFAYQKGGRS